MNEKKQSSLSDKDLLKLRLMGAIAQRTLDEYTDNRYSLLGETTYSWSDKDADNMADIITKNT